MRLRLVHTLSLLRLSAVLLAVLAMGAVTAWNLESGFEDCLEGRDIERLDALELLPRAVAKGLALSVSAVAPKALPVRWDRARIEQLLGNLLENSLRYTDAPGRIAVTLERQGQRIFIDIADSAPGVPAADLRRLFEPLNRAELARSRHQGGSGLGLAIRKAIVRSHGGRIEAACSSLGGLRLRIELPATEPS